VPLRRQDVTNVNSKLEQEFEQALKSLNELKEFLGNDHHLLANVTVEDLRNSRSLRTTLIEYKEFFFFTTQRPPKSFVKKYENEEQRKVDDYQSIYQSSMMKDLDRLKENFDKNLNMIRDHAMGEEGVDFIQSIGGIEDPSLPNEKILEKQIRREINALKLSDPDLAQAYEDHMFKKNEYDEMFAH
jgi:hypothetical protein